MRWLLALCLVVGTASAHADGRLYGELYLGGGGVRYSSLDQDFDAYPIFGGVTLGAYVLPGLGLEVFADQGIATDEEQSFDIGLEEAFGAAARFQSPSIGGTSGYIVLGYVDFTVEQEQDGASALSESFTGARFSVGLMQRLSRFPSLQVSAEYRNYYVDEPVRVDGLVLGLRLNTP